MVRIYVSFVAIWYMRLFLVSCCVCVILPKGVSDLKREQYIKSNTLTDSLTHTHTNMCSRACVYIYVCVYTCTHKRTHTLNCVIYACLNFL